MGLGRPERMGHQMVLVLWTRVSLWMFLLFLSQLVVQDHGTFSFTVQVFMSSNISILGTLVCL